MDLTVVFFFVVSRYRRVLSNNCKEGVRRVFSPRRQACRPRPPRGLRLITGHGELSSTVGSNVTFMLYLDEVSHIGTKEVELNLNTGMLTSYSNHLY